MRHVHALFATALMIAATPAAADTVVETIAVAGDVGTQPVFVTGPLFNPALGTLTAVSAAVSGQFRADIFVPASSGIGPSITLALEYSFASDGSITGGVLGDVDASTDSDGTYLGETGFDYTRTISATGAYIKGAPDETNYLAALAFAAVPQPAIGLGASDDFSSWSGDLQLTYTYDPALPVPEPACTTLFALACLGLAGARGMLAHAHATSTPPDGAHLNEPCGGIIAVAGQASAVGGVGTAFFYAAIGWNGGQSPPYVMPGGLRIRRPEYGCGD